ncbi:MAG TPA: cysteine desulfurase [Deltaproteobacteria bacterium]|nr:cysteine desulfurase [Deltaproteobacteria bacterium]
MKRIYLDYLASTPVAPEVVEAMLSFIEEHFGNPASIHSFGEKPQEAIFTAREQVARLLNSKPEEIIFTSCGTEGNNLAIKGIAFANRDKGNHIVISAIEHFSVFYCAKALEDFGFSVSFVPVDKYGMVDPDDVKKAITDETILVSVMLANNEVGTIQPIEEISKITTELGIFFHCDGVAAVGQIPIDVKKLGVDSLSLAGNIFYAPKGIGALYLREGVKLWPLFHGGGQEDGRRTGTENLPGIVGLGKAAELAIEKLPFRQEHYRNMINRLKTGIESRIDEIYFNGHPEKRLPGNLNVSFKYVEGEALLLHMDLAGVAVAGASACMSITAKASHVLEAMGALKDGALGTLLFTVGDETTASEIDFTVEVLQNVVKNLRDMSPLYNS